MDPAAAPVSPYVAPDGSMAPATGVHPDLMVPQEALYAQYTTEDLLAQQGRGDLDVLNPDRLPITFWYIF